MSQSVDEAIAGFSPEFPLAVALSGGADSTALLLACAARWPGQVEALHVHHGLQPAADRFESHCRALCERLSVPLTVARVDARAAPGASPEDTARRARYAAFFRMASTGRSSGAIETIAIAQHADDQVETLLLALSRGAGLPGLAAMPTRVRRGGVWLARPLLQVPGPTVRAWLRARGEDWVEDPTNADTRYTRNRIRARLMPALHEAFPAFRETFARSAAHAAQAQGLLDEVAAEDLAGCGCPPELARLRSLGRARQANLLRHWLRQVHGATPSAAQLAELLDQLAACRTRGHQIAIRVGHGIVRRCGDHLDWFPA